MTSSSVQPHPGQDARDEISLLELLAPPLRRWKLVAAVALFFGVIAGAVSLLIPPRYTGVTTFSQETSSSLALGGLTGLAGLAGLAGQMGLSTGAGGNQTPDFLASVLHSRELLQATLASEFEDPRRPGTRAPLLSLLQLKGNSTQDRLNEGVRALGKLAQASVDRKTGIVTLRVTMRSPKLASDVANRMTQLLDQFNVHRRRTQSGEQRRFVGERLAEAERELRRAEQEHVQFLQRNRRYTQSPLLVYEESRLERNVRLKQEVFLSLTKSHEDARIAEVRDTPSLTIIDSAVPPTRKSSPHRKVITLLGLMFGGVAGLGAVYLTELRRSARREDRADSRESDSREFMDAWEEPRREVSGSTRRPAK